MFCRSATLSAAGPRNKVSEDEARTIQSHWQTTLANNAAASPPVSITKLDLSCRAWPLPTLLILEPTLALIAPTVTHLQIDDIIASLETEDGFATLAFFNRVFHPEKAPHITRIDLDDNALGTRSLSYIPDLLESPNLKHLFLNNCGMSAEVASALVDILGRTTAPHLVSLDLSRNQIGAAGAASIGRLLAACTSLETFKYAGSRPLAAGTASLLRGLAESVEAGNTNIIELDLDDCNLLNTNEDDEDKQNEALRLLSTVIRSSPNLSKLNVKDGGELGQSGLEILTDALIQAEAPLAYLDVGCLELEADGTADLAAYIRDHCSETLVELHVETNMMEDEGLRSLLEVLVDCPNLRVLNITENGLEEGGFEALADTKIPSLQKLYMKENMEEDIDDDAKEKIRALYPVVLMADDDEEEAAEEAVAEESAAEAPAAAAEEEADVDALAAQIGEVAL